MNNSIALGRPVHLVYVDPKTGQKGWYVRTETRQNPTTKVWEPWPLIDDDPSQSTPLLYEYAVIACRRWRNELNLNFHIALDASPLAEFVDPDPAAPTAPPWIHADCWVTVTEAGEPIDDLDSPWVYEIKAVHTPEHGRAFVLKFGLGVLQNQSQFASFDEGPEACVQKAFARGFTKIEKPKPNPSLEARRQEAQRQAQQLANASRGRFRPGDIS